MIEKADALQLLADGLTLAYHEARHVRILAKAGHLPIESWAPFIDLPRNRVEAWKALSPLRREASLQPRARDAAQLFALSYGRSAAELAVLYSNPHWRDAAAVGGRAWALVVARVLSLRDAIDAGDPPAFRPACARLVGAGHNSGRLRDKIVELDRSAGYDTHPLWERLVSDA